MSDSDEWEDCEETTVLVEIHGIIKPNFLQNVEVAKVLGIDTDTPYLQLDDNTFRGNYQDCLGTCLLFKDKTDYNADGLEEGQEIQPELEYFGKTCKKLSMQRVFIKGSADSEKNNNQGTSLEEPENQSTVGTLPHDNITDTSVDQPSQEENNEESGNNDTSIKDSTSTETRGTAMNDT